MTFIIVVDDTQGKRMPATAAATYTWWHLSLFVREKRYDGLKTTVILVTDWSESFCARHQVLRWGVARCF
jgi:hypothetical protein